MNTNNYNVKGLNAYIRKIKSQLPDVPTDYIRKIVYLLIDNIVLSLLDKCESDDLCIVKLSLDRKTGTISLSGINNLLLNEILHDRFSFESFEKLIRDYND